MSTLKNKLEKIEASIKQLEKERLAVYEASLRAPEDEKVESDFMSRAMIDFDKLPKLSDSFPVTISGLHWKESKSHVRDFALVAVRPVSEIKTYLGIYVGDLPIGGSCSYHPDSQVLTISPNRTNPAIVVPALGRVVYGAESWWRRIKKEDDLDNITDEDVQGTWWVEMLRRLVS